MLFQVGLRCVLSHDRSATTALIFSARGGSFDIALLLFISRGPVAASRLHLLGNLFDVGSRTVEIHAEFSYKREELHEVHVFHEARPAFPRVPTDTIFHPPNGLSDQAVRTQRGEVQLCEGMRTLIFMRLSEVHVLLNHPGGEFS